MPTTMRLIAKNVLSSSSATVTFSSIPSTYTDLMLVYSARHDRNAADGNVLIGFNGSTANFANRTLQGTGSIAVSATDDGGGRLLGAGNGSTSTSNTFASGECYIPNYAAAANKSFSATSAQETNASAATMYAVAGLWSNTSAISSIEISAGSTVNFVSGSSFFLYGITKA